MKNYSTVVYELGTFTPKEHITSVPFDIVETVRDGLKKLNSYNMVPLMVTEDGTSVYIGMQVPNSNVRYKVTIEKVVE